MKTLLFLLLPALAFAVDYPAPIPRTGSCKVTAVSSATPARVTVESIGACGIASTDVDTTDGDTEPDNRIFMSGARSSYAGLANVLNVNNHAANGSDEDGLCSIALNISGNSFDLMKCDGVTPRTASATYFIGGFIWRVRRMTLRAGPNILLDGTGNPVLAGIQDTTTGTGWADPARFPMTAIAAGADAYIASAPAHGKDIYMNKGAMAALRWYAQGKPGSSTSKDAALNSLTNIRQWVGTMACDETSTGGNSGCGQAASEMMDYRSAHYGLNTLMLIVMMWDELSAGEKTFFLNYFLNDIEQNKGGHNFPGTSLTKPTFESRSGTIAYGTGATTITGTSASFVSGDVGKYIIFPCGATNCDGFAQQAKILAVNEGTQTLTIDRVTPNAESGRSYRIAPQWEETHTGYLWFSKHFADSANCGGNVFQGGALFGCPDYPPAGGQGINSPTSNHSLVRSVMHMAIGIAFANYDIRARWLLAEAAGYFYHVIYPGSLFSYTGITSAASVGYSPGRQSYAPIVGLGLLKTAVTDSVEYAHSEFVDNFAAWRLAGTIPGTDKIVLSQNDGSENDTQSLHNYAANMPIMLYYPTSTYAGAIKKDTEYAAAFSSTANYLRQSMHQTVAHVGYRPDITPVTLTNPTYKFRSTGSLCTAQWSYFCRPVSAPSETITRTAMVSRIGTQAAQVKQYYWDVVGYSHADQGTQMAETGLYLNANGKMLVAPDGRASDNRYGTLPKHFGNILFSGINLWNGGSYPNIATTVEERMAGNQYYAAGTADLVDHYTTSPGGPVRRSWIHAKRGSNDYVLEWFHLPAAGTVPYHLYIAGFSNATTGTVYQTACGTPTSSSCITLNRAAGTWSNTQGSAAKVMSKALGTATVSTENASDTNGSYTGGNGRTFRVDVNGTSFGVLHRVTTNTSETLATETVLTSGSWSGVQVADGTSPAVMLVAPTNQTSLSGVSPTVSSYQLVAAGLAAGTYKVQVDSVDVSGCTAIAVQSGEHTLDCASVPAGALTIAAVGGGGGGGAGVGTQLRNLRSLRNVIVR